MCDPLDKVGVFRPFTANKKDISLCPDIFSLSQLKIFYKKKIRQYYQKKYFKVECGQMSSLKFQWGSQAGNK